MFKTIATAFKDKAIRKSIIVTILLLLVFRLGCYLPIPGIATDGFGSIGDNGILSLLNTISGSALANGSFLALSVTPYINASIIIQLLTVAIPPLERMSKDGDEGQKKIAKITKYVALVLAVAQAIGIVLGFKNSFNGLLDNTLFGAKTPEWIVSMYVIVMLVAGSCFTMWLGDRITDQKIGNGVSLIIFVGILASAGLSLVTVLKRIFAGNLNALWVLLGFLVLLVLIFTLIVFVDLAERKIPVQYAKQVKGRKMYGGQSSYIPMKVNAGGVMPIIFATAIITFPSMIMQIAGVTRESGGFAKFYYDWLGTGTITYVIFVGLLILAFSFFYAQIMFNPVDVAQRIQQNGGFIPGIRAGKPTADYLGKVNRRLTLFGAIFLAFIATIPSIIFTFVADKNAPELINAFTATGMLIVVSVAIEFQQALDSQIMMKRHKNIL